MGKNLQFVFFSLKLTKPDLYIQKKTKSVGKPSLKHFLLNKIRKIKEPTDK